MALEAVPAQPPGRMELVPVVNPQVKRPPSRPADELEKRERRVQGRLAIAAAAGAATPEQPEEVPSSSSAGPQYKTPEQLAPLAAARQAVKPAELPPAVRRLKAASFPVNTNMVGMNAGFALGADTSGSRPTVPTLNEAVQRNEPFRGRPFRLKSAEPVNRRLYGKQPADRARSARSRSAGRRVGVE